MKAPPALLPKTLINSAKLSCSRPSPPAHRDLRASYRFPYYAENWCYRSRPDRHFGGTGICHSDGISAIAIVGFLSAIYQGGRAASAGVGLIAKRPEELGKAIVYAVMVETYAVLALLASVLLLLGIGL